MAMAGSNIGSASRGYEAGVTGSSMAEAIVDEGVVERADVGELKVAY